MRLPVTPSIYSFRIYVSCNMAGPLLTCSKRRAGYIFWRGLHHSVQAYGCAQSRHEHVTERACSDSLCRAVCALPPTSLHSNRRLPCSHMYLPTPACQAARVGGHKRLHGNPSEVVYLKEKRGLQVFMLSGDQQRHRTSVVSLCRLGLAFIVAKAIDSMTHLACCMLGSHAVSHLRSDSIPAVACNTRKLVLVDCRSKSILT